MREIKFRGRSSIGSWHYGNLTTTSYEDKGQLKYVYAISGINDKSYYSGIEGKTVGQFIGLKDKNGDEIYEQMELNNIFIIKWLKFRYVLLYISNLTTFEEIFDYENKLEITGEYREI